MDQPQCLDSNRESSSSFGPWMLVSHRRNRGRGRAPGGQTSRHQNSQDGDTLPRHSSGPTHVAKRGSGSGSRGGVGRRDGRGGYYHTNSERSELCGDVERCYNDALEPDPGHYPFSPPSCDEVTPSLHPTVEKPPSLINEPRLVPMQPGSSSQELTQLVSRGSDPRNSPSGLNRDNSGDIVKINSVDRSPFPLISSSSPSSVDGLSSSSFADRSKDHLMLVDRVVGSICLPTPSHPAGDMDSECGDQLESSSPDIIMDPGDNSSLDSPMNDSKSGSLLRRSLVITGPLSKKGKTCPNIS